MSNGYHEGLACEHAFPMGPPCDDAVAWITPTGRALCDKHFNDFINGAPRMLVDSRRLTP